MFCLFLSCEEGLSRTAKSLEGFSKSSIEL